MQILQKRDHGFFRYGNASGGRSFSGIKAVKKNTASCIGNPLCIVIGGKHVMIGTSAGGQVLGESKTSMFRGGAESDQGIIIGW